MVIYENSNSTISYNKAVNLILQLHANEYFRCTNNSFTDEKPDTSIIGRLWRKKDRRRQMRLYWDHSGFYNPILDIGLRF